MPSSHEILSAIDANRTLSKIELVEFYRETESSKRQEFYFIVLRKLERVVEDDDVKKLDTIVKVFESVYELEQAEVFTSCNRNTRNPFLQSSIVIKACRHGSLAILKCFREIELLQKISTWTQGKKFDFSDRDELSHHAFYYAVRSGNVDLLETLIEVCKSLNAGFEDLGSIISSSYRDLKLRQVSLSAEMEFCVTHYLLTLQCFADQSKSSGQNRNSLDELVHRVNDTVEKIELLVADYQNNDEDVDSRFLYLAKVIALNIHVLKRLLRSTYDLLPWEEIEFCMYAHITRFAKTSEEIIFSHAVLSKDRLLSHLGNFSKKLKEVTYLENLKKSNLRVLPKLKREAAISKIISFNPEFQPLYDDYKILRDVRTLIKISDSIKYSSSTDPKSRDGQMVILRSIQVIGEHLKSTLESPKLSMATSDLLLTSLPKETRRILADLRNSISHSFSLIKRMEIEQNSNSAFFEGLKADLTLIGNVIRHVLLRKKIKIIKMLLNQIVDSSDPRDTENVLKVMECIQFEQMLNIWEDSESVGLKVVIEKFRNITPEKTPFEELLFQKIDILISEYKENFNDYKTGVMLLKSMSVLTCNLTSNYSYFGAYLKSESKLILNIFSNKAKREIYPKVTDLLSQVFRSIMARTQNEDLPKIILEICLSSEMNLKWITELRGEFCNDPYNSNVIYFKEEDLSKVLQVKTAELKVFLEKHGIATNSLKNVSSLVAKRSQLLVLEMVVLDILTITDALRSLPHDTHLLDYEVPILYGKVLRNHLAHDNHLFELLITDPVISLVSNAVLLVTETVDYNALCQNNSYRRKYLFAEEMKSILNQQKLFNYLEKCSLNFVRTCVAEGADLNGLDFRSYTTLHVASKASSITVLEYLIENSNVSVKSTDKAGSLPLHIAAKCGQKHIVEFYIQVKELPVDAIDNYNRTPLHYASIYGHADTVSLLLNLKANIGSKDIAMSTPVLYSITHNHLPVVEVLLSQYEPEQLEYSLTCLFFASEAGCLEVVNYLIEKHHGVNVRTEKGSTPLHAASHHGHLDVAKLLISKGSEIDARDIHCRTPLHYAVGDGHSEIVRALVKNGADVNVPDKMQHWTPLHVASDNGFREIVDILLKSGSNPKTRTKKGAIPLHLACRNGDVEIVAILIEKGSDVNAKDAANRTPLHFAAEKGNVHVIDLLVTRNALANVTDTIGCTPLHSAVLKNQLEAVQKLISYGSKVDAVLPNGLTPLHIASSKNYLKVIECLIAHKACIGAKDGRGFTPLHWSAFEAHTEAASLLLKYGADINAIDDKGMTPLNVASICGNELVLKLLIRKNADFGIKSIDSWSPLHCAALSNNANCVKALLQKGSDVNAKDKEGFTPLVYAVKSNNIDIVKLLVSSGLRIDSDFYSILSLAITLGYQSIAEHLIKSCDVNHKIKDFTLLHLAATRGHFGIVECLLKHGADANIKTNHNATPLYLAAQEGHEKVVEILLSHKADCNAKNRDGYTPLLAASRQGHFKVVELLLKHGADPNLKDYENRSPIEMAVSYGKKKAAEVLIELGAVELNGQGNDGFSLLHIAADNNQHEMIRFLVAKGCDIHAKKNLGTKPIHIAAREGSVKIVEFLLDSGCCVDEPGSDNQTLLHYACITGQLKVIKCLVNRGANVNAADDNGLTPLHIASYLSHKDAVELLLSHGAIYDIAEKQGKKPWEITYNGSIKMVFMSVSRLFEAIKKNSVTEVQQCIKAGVVIDCKNSKNASPLHIAAWKGFSEIVKVLLKNKCNPNILGSSGNTPLHYASKFSREPVVEALLCSGAKYNIASEKGKTPVNIAQGSGVISLLQLVQEVFNMAQTNNSKLIAKLLEIKSKTRLTAVMNARNKDNLMLVDVALCNNFSKIDQLLKILRGKGPSLIQEAENLAAVGNYKKAENILYRELENKVEYHGEDNPLRLDIQSKIAAYISKQGNYAGALKIQEEVYQKRRNKLGDDHSLVLESREAVAFTLHAMGRNDQAYKVYEELYNKQKNSLGPTHEDTLKSKFHMALVLDKLGRYDEALSHNKFVYEEYKKKNSLPQALFALNNLAMVLSHQDKGNEALKVFEDVLKQKQKLFGNEHPDTLRTSQHIAGILMNQNKLSEALAVAKPTLKSQQKVLGPTHPDSLVTYTYISNIYFQLDKWHEAYKCLKEIVELHKTAPGTLDPMIDRLYLQLEVIKTKIRWENESESRFQDVICPELVVAAKSGDAERVQSLLRKGSDVNERDAADGKTSLHIAASNGDSSLVRLLLKKGADPTLVSTKGETPLHAAVSKKHNKPVVRILLDHSDRSATNEFINAATFDEGNSALHEASRNGDFSVVLLLLQKGAKYDSRNSKGETPAAASPDGEVRRFLKLVDDLFESTKTGCPKMLAKIKSLGKEEKLAVFNARNSLEHTLVQSLLRKNHMNLASQLIKLFKSI